MRTTGLTFIIAVLIVAAFFCGCAEKSQDPKYHHYRAMYAGSVTLMTLMPQNVTYTKYYDNLDEMISHSKDVPVNLLNHEYYFAQGVRDALAGHMKISSVLESGDTLRILADDPRGKKSAGYALLEPFTPPPAKPREWTPEWEAEQRRLKALKPVDDPRAKYLLFTAYRPFGNDEIKYYLSLDTKDLNRKIKTKYLLLLTVDSIQLVSAGGYWRCDIQTTTRLYNRKTNKLISSTSFIHYREIPGNGTALVDSGKIEGTLKGLTDEAGEIVLEQLYSKIPR